MGETENILQTIKTKEQDIVAPDVRELKVRMTSLEGRMTSLETRMTSLEGRMTSLEEQTKAQFEAFHRRMDAQFEAMQRQSDAQFKALMAAIGQVKAELELSSYKQIAARSERVAALEAHRQ